jgi:hypothetical protein
VKIQKNLWVALYAVLLMATACSEPLEGIMEEPWSPGAPPSLEWSTYSGAVWSQSGVNKYTSTNKTHNSQSWLQLKITASADCSIMITMSASSEVGRDMGYMSKLNGGAGTSSYLARISGTAYHTDTYSVPAGSHYIYFGYVKNVSLSANNDNVIVQVMSID